MPEIDAAGIRDLVGTSPLMLEIGCNDGTDTLRFLEAMPGARIYCFEPDARAIARFHEFVDDERVTLTKAALSDRSGSATFYGSSGIPPEAQRTPDATHYCFLPEWDLSGSLNKPTGHFLRSSWVTFPEGNQFAVRTMRLDDWLEPHVEIDRIDFIWMDVQGAENSVIRGAPLALKITNYLYTEFCDTQLYEGQANLQEITAMLPDFTLVGTYCENALFKNKSM